MRRQFCTLITRAADGGILDVVEVDRGRRARITVRRAKKILQGLPGVARVDRVNSVEDRRARRR